MSSEIRAAVIRAHFCVLRERAGILPELHRLGYKSEAMLIACCYIEAASKKLLPRKSGNKQRFVSVLVEHGGGGRLRLIHPSQLLERLPEGEDSAAKALRARMDTGFTAP